MVNPDSSSLAAGSPRQVIGLALALACVTLAVYWPVTGHDFINFDDPDYVTLNPVVQAGLTWRGVVWAFTQSHAANWHPLTWLSHMLDCQLFGLDAGKHHLMAALFHTANTVLVLLVLRALTGALWRSALVTAWFALHPLHVESVAWVAERKDVLSAFFGLLTLWAYTRYARAKAAAEAATAVEPVAVAGNQPDQFASATPSDPTTAPVSATSQAGGTIPRVTPSPRPRYLVFYWLTLGLFALGLMSKPMLVTWPFVLLLLDYWPLRRFELRPGRWEWTKLGRLVVEKWPVFLLTVASSVTTFVVQRSAGAMASLERTPLDARIINAVVSYVTYLRKMFWPSDLALIYLPPLQWEMDLVALAGASLVLVTVGVVAAARWRYLPVGWFWYVGTLVPVIGLVQVGNQSMADRYTYLPLLGIFIMLAWGGWDLARSWTAGRWVAGIVATATVVACAGLTHGQLRHWQTSETVFRRCIEVTEDNYLACNNLGSYYLGQNQLEEAEVMFQEALGMRPYYADALLNLGVLYTRQGKIEQATNYLHAAIRIYPKYAESYGKLAYTMTQEGRFEEALAYYRQAIALQPSLSEAHNNLAWLLATLPDARLRNGAEAVELAERACRLTGYSKTIYVGTLAAAYAEAGRFAEAVAIAKHAIALAEKNGEPELAAKNRELLALYEAGKPYRETPPTISHTESRAIK